MLNGPQRKQGGTTVACGASLACELGSYSQHNRQDPAGHGDRDRRRGAASQSLAAQRLGSATIGLRASVISELLVYLGELFDGDNVKRVAG